MSAYPRLCNPARKHPKRYARQYAACVVLAVAVLAAIGPMIADLFHAFNP